MKSKEYLEEIRKSEGLKRAVLRKIEVRGKTAVFTIATDLSYHDEDIAHARTVTAEYVPEGLNAEVKIVKAVPSAEGVRAGILEILKNRFPAVAAFVTPEDVEVDLETGGGRFSVGVTDGERAKSSAVLDCVCSELARGFCGVWHGEFRYVSKAVGEIQTEIPPEEKVIGPRCFEITDYQPIDGGNPTTAVYLADLNTTMENVAICGRVTYIEERLTKNNKPFFSISISDGTASLRLSYFSKKATLEKVRSVQAGDGVCFTGDNEVYNGSLSFRAKTIDFGSQPKGFVPQTRPSRPVPARYLAVFPSPIEDYVQSGLFDTVSSLPEEMRSRDFVVFDLETTGLNNVPSSAGTMDRIIEIGAVKIKGGKIAEKFSSFVACPTKLTNDIVRLTGITDEMLVGAPDVKTVMADFYRFAAGCDLVGHNVQFDYKFVRHYGELEGYVFDCRTYDTLSLSQELLRLSNYKLNTVADHFGFTFEHHRAYNDAFVTAKIFLELVRRKGALPK